MTEEVLKMRVREVESDLAHLWKASVDAYRRMRNIRVKPKKDTSFYRGALLILIWHTFVNVLQL